MNAGLCFMGNTSVQDQEQGLQGGYHGQGNLLMRKPSLFFHLTSLMAPNGSHYNKILYIYIYHFCKTHLGLLLFMRSQENLTNYDIYVFSKNFFKKIMIFMF